MALTMLVAVAVIGFALAPELRSCSSDTLSALLFSQENMLVAESRKPPSTFGLTLVSLVSQEATALWEHQLSPTRCQDS